MNKIAVLLTTLLMSMVMLPERSVADSGGDELSRWIDQRGRQVWGDPPSACDDLTFVRRVYLDLVGRVPSVAEIRDFQKLGDDRRELLVGELVFGEGPRRETYTRLSAASLARHWRRVLLPPGTVTLGPAQTLETWLTEQFKQGVPYDEMMRGLAQIQSPQSAGNYFQLLGGTPENYAGNLSRVMLGVRIDCAQCHDHPFTDWKQSDFWGLAAFYSDLPGTIANPDASKPTGKSGEIRYEGTTYAAKFLWQEDALPDASRTPRVRLARWMTSPENPNFSATAVNRFWQLLVGHGLYWDVENLDLATSDERAFLDELGDRFAEDGFNVQQLIAAICKSDWYAAQSMQTNDDNPSFQRELKVISPEQVFDSLEQSLHLPISRIDPSAPRWTGARTQMVNRLGEAVGATPEDYASGIPQALMMMNGKVTADAIDLDRSRLLRAVVESPFFDENTRIETLYLAVLTRQPTETEMELLTKYLDEKPNAITRRQAFGEILWALLNSPEFVLCR
ncbi:DUF1549 and DUF1553 domain-containing protein [Stieleria sp. TO1_6]|uniref:DUF1549 domain-containing protein n=1 Tax=Stieleria tagensis TaxID=2956795 RepID=UPI00209AD132|nr:DUF1549 domain-containing protein [Stieleria tagensis]MCO8122437.1 DUF1549 and DUF1553 domain-containing protein [Stieleria tagensis]